MNALFKSQFSYCSLVWMCHSRANNAKINRLNKRCLQIMYADKQSSVQTLLEKDGSVSFHNQNPQIHATEMYKLKNDLSSLLVTDLFEQRNEEQYCLRKNSHFTLLPITIVYRGSESISFLGPKMWSILPSRLKNANNRVAQCFICTNYFPDTSLLDK